MPKIKPSKPFANGAEYRFFIENFCERCLKHKLNEYGEPLPDNCKIETAINSAYFDEKKYVVNKDIVQVGDMGHICKHFRSETAELMKHYQELFLDGDND